VRWRLTARELYQLPASGSICCGLYRGRLGHPSLRGTAELGIAVDPEEPIEPAADGCPGGWYRTPYVDSLAKYVRHRTDTGGRVHNPFFARADWQIQEAVMFFEHEQERWEAYRREVDRQRWIAQREG
jgi:hypothetical protein